MMSRIISHRLRQGALALLRRAPGAPCPVTVSQRRPLATPPSGQPCVAVVGAGPAGFYTAQQIVKASCDKTRKLLSFYGGHWIHFVTPSLRETCCPSVAEWIKAQDFDASAGGESPVRAPVRAAALCPYV